MLFNSIEFVVFAAIVFPIYYSLRTQSAALGWLLAASWAFYATWSPYFLLLLIATTWVDFTFAQRIHQAGNNEDGQLRARRLLILSVVMNLSVLAFFKYGRFAYEQLALILPLPPSPAFLPTSVPLGVSFYTFHSISYIVDTYRGLRAPTYRFDEFALYVAFFPQLIAGPITRWSFLGPQIQAPRTISRSDVETGVFLVAKGLIKKVLLADSLGEVVDQVYASPEYFAPVEITLALYAYAFQIYFDFSGYTNIAQGLARLLGFQLPENFRHPYRAVNPQDFWQRWHISLSSWLRDYLYISLGGNRRGTTRTYFNLLITMVLGGLWHGAAWNFVLWGAFHGAWLAVHRAVARPEPRTPAWLRRLVTFHLVLAGWVLFRAPTLGSIGSILRGLVGNSPMSGPFPVVVAMLVVIGFILHRVTSTVDLEARWAETPRFVQGVLMGVVLLLIGVFSAQSQRFIYFQF